MDPLGARQPSHLRAKTAQVTCTTIMSRPQHHAWCTVALVRRSLRGLTTDRAQKNMDDALEKLLAVEKTHRLVR